MRAAVDLMSRRPTASLARWPRARWCRTLRTLLQWVLLFPLVRLFVRPLVGRGSVPGGPAIFAANHASHADAAVLLRALPHRIREHTAAAAAEDYFFRDRFRAALVQLLIGAFPFPRRGVEGLERARALLDAGESVLLVPEGTRSIDGRIASFRCGVGRLASEGATVVPVAIVGTSDVLAKGRGIPRRAAVSIVFGEPVRARGTDPQTATGIIEREVRDLHARASLARPATTQTWFARARSFARTPRALWLVFGWAVAEALFLPIVPDVPVALLSVVAPGRFLAFAVAALAGSLTGGTLAYGLGALGAAGVLHHLPLVTERMISTTNGWLHDGGSRAMWRQPFSGVPFKVFGYQASAHVSLGGFLVQTGLARGLRFVEVGAAFSAFGVVCRPGLRHAYAGFVIVFGAVFGVGLARVVASWS